MKALTTNGLTKLIQLIKSKFNEYRKITASSTAPLSPQDGEIWIDTNDDSSSDVFELVSNKVTSINSSSTNTQYPSAKCVYDYATPNVITGTITSIHSSINVSSYTLRKVNNDVYFYMNFSVNSNISPFTNLCVLQQEFFPDNIVTFMSIEYSGVAGGPTPGRIFQDGKLQTIGSLSDEGSYAMSLVYHKE